MQPNPNQPLQAGLIIFQNLSLKLNVAKVVLNQGKLSICRPFIEQYYLTARQLLIIRSLGVVTGGLVLPKCLEYYGGHNVEIRELQVGTETSI